VSYISGSDRHFKLAWQSVIGQERAKNVLQRSIAEGRIAHAYLFWGPRGAGKDALAIEFAKTLLCENKSTEACGHCQECKKVSGLRHPDLRFIFALPASKPGRNSAERTENFDNDVEEDIRVQLERKARDPYFHIMIPRASFINIGSIRNIRRESSLSAFGSGKKIFIISDADMMNDASSNALLKVLEEPLEETIFILTTSRRENLRPTIISRCQAIRCESLTDMQIEEALSQREGADAQQAKLIAKLSNGDYSYAGELLSEDVLAQRAEAVRFLRVAVGSRTADLMNDIDERAGSGDRIAAQQFLRVLGVWFHDALMMRERNGQGVINEDLREDLEKFHHRFGNADISAALRAIDNSLELVRKNVYLPLIFISLAIQLKRCIRHVETV
jgi:DNA polymerase III subunit delta'